MAHCSCGVGCRSVVRCGGVRRCVAAHCCVCVCVCVFAGCATVPHAVAPCCVARHGVSLNRDAMRCDARRRWSLPAVCGECCWIVLCRVAVWCDCGLLCAGGRAFRLENIAAHAHHKLSCCVPWCSLVCGACASVSVCQHVGVSVCQHVGVSVQDATSPGLGTGGPYITSRLQSQYCMSLQD